MPENGAKNAALMSIEILALADEALAEKYAEFKQLQHDTVVKTDQKIQSDGWERFIKA